MNRRKVWLISLVLVYLLGIGAGYTAPISEPKLKNFLFDRVLPDWFNANGARTRFSLDDLGYYTFVETAE